MDDAGSPEGRRFGDAAPVEPGHRADLLKALEEATKRGRITRHTRRALAEILDILLRAGWDKGE